MGQAIIANLRTKVTEFKGTSFLNENFKQYFDKGLAKSFFHEEEMLQIMSGTGKYVNLKNFNTYDIKRT